MSDFSMKDPTQKDKVQENHDDSTQSNQTHSIAISIQEAESKIEKNLNSNQTPKSPPEIDDDKHKKKHHKKDKTHKRPNKPPPPPDEEITEKEIEEAQKMMRKIRQKEKSPKSQPAAENIETAEKSDHHIKPDHDHKIKSSTPEEEIEIEDSKKVKHRNHKKEKSKAPKSPPPPPPDEEITEKEIEEAKKMMKKIHKKEKSKAPKIPPPPPDEEITEAEIEAANKMWEKVNGIPNTIQIHPTAHKRDKKAKKSKAPKIPPPPPPDEEITEKEIEEAEKMLGTKISIDPTNSLTHKSPIPPPKSAIPKLPQVSKFPLRPLTKPKFQTTGSIPQQGIDHMEDVIDSRNSFMIEKPSSSRTEDEAISSFFLSQDDDSEDVEIDPDLGPKKTDRRKILHDRFQSYSSKAYQQMQLDNITSSATNEYEESKDDESQENMESAKQVDTEKQKRLQRYKKSLEAYINKVEEKADFFWVDTSRDNRILWRKDPANLKNSELRGIIKQLENKIVSIRIENKHVQTEIEDLYQVLSDKNQALAKLKARLDQLQNAK